MCYVENETCLSDRAGPCRCKRCLWESNSVSECGAQGTAGCLRHWLGPALTILIIIGFNSTCIRCLLVLHGTWSVDACICNNNIKYLDLFSVYMYYTDIRRGMYPWCPRAHHSLVSSIYASALHACMHTLILVATKSPPSFRVPLGYRYSFFVWNDSIVGCLSQQIRLVEYVFDKIDFCRLDMMSK